MWAFGIKEKDVAEENRFGQTDLFMKVTGIVILPTDKED